MQKKWMQNLLIVIVLAVFFVLVQLAINSGLLNEYLQTNLFLIGIYIILSASLNLINGFTGEFSLGHAGFMAVGAYTGVVMTMNFQLPLPLAIVGGMVMAAIFGLIVGLPTLRLNGDYLAIATLGFGEIIRVLLNNSNYLGGATGILGIPRIVTWPWLFGCTVFTVVVIRNFMGSTHGRACLAVRENDLAARMMGINITYYKVLAFVLGAALAGMAGVLYGHYFYVLQPQKFSFMLSFDVLVMIMVGGLGSITGSCVGAILITILSAFLQSVPEFRMVIYALLLIISAIYRPQGITGEKEVSARLLEHWGGAIRAVVGHR